MKKTQDKMSGFLMLINPLLNKGTAFTEEERKIFDLEGLLPPHVSTIEEQVKRRYANFCEQEGDLAKYIFLSALQNRNEILFYRFVLEHVNEMVPLIYTPTVGQISTYYSLLYREQRGLYLSYPHRKKIQKMIENFPFNDIDVIVVTDGERILGLGDLGVGGMAISVGKLTLYTLFGGIHPARTLPIILDVGTNNSKMLEDPLYIGWRNNRISGRKYDLFIEEFIKAIRHRYPNVLLQWEDFAKEHALTLLNTYRNALCSFNDDIQGTAAVVLAAIYSAINLSKSSLKQQRFVILGGGSAGLGIANQLVKAILEEGGISKEKACALFYIVDRQGLLVEGREYSDSQSFFVHSQKTIKSWKFKDSLCITLQEVIENVHPTVLIGVSTHGGAFTEEIVKTMHKHVKRPIIFPLSNPTSLSEAKPIDLIQWTKGEAIIATGSPFDPVAYEGSVFSIAQCNNVYIFPGIGLGLIASKATYASDKIFIEAAKVLSEHSPMLKDPYGPIFPTLDHLREVSRQIGIKVAKTVIAEGYSKLKAIDSVEKLIEETMWYPHYPHYK